MIFSAVAAVSILSLLPFSRGLALDVNTRQNDCGFVCPDTDVDGFGLFTFTADESTTFCSYSIESTNSCSYDVVSVYSLRVLRIPAHTVAKTTGALVGGNDSCPKQAIQQCFARRSRQLKQAVMRRGVYDGDSNEWEPAPSPWVNWKREETRTSHPKRTAPSPTRDKGSDSWPNPKPTPSPSPSPWKPGPQPPKELPCKYRCPRKDLAKNPLTDGAIRDSFLYCSYSTPDCKTCSFCKYSTVRWDVEQIRWFADGQCVENWTPS